MSMQGGQRGLGRPWIQVHGGFEQHGEGDTGKGLVEVNGDGDIFGMAGIVVDVCGSHGEKWQT